jgi:hypothetical protein
MIYTPYSLAFRIRTYFSFSPTWHLHYSLATKHVSWSESPTNQKEQVYTQRCPNTDRPTASGSRRGHHGIHLTIGWESPSRWEILNDQTGVLYDQAGVRPPTRELVATLAVASTIGSHELSTVKLTPPA